jgi:FkbM family methyltransferase
MAAGLIYDVGVENGDDSAYYLHKGFKVVGVEASPVAAERLRKRFEAEIGDGRYVLLPVGIAASAGKAEFWVCDDHSHWSSFDRSIASRSNCRHHPVRVETRTFGSILDEFGRAAFCKIDIEGNDNLCIEALSAETRPPYLSVEVIRGDEQLGLLRSKGYTRFKFISQRSFRQPLPTLIKMKAHLPQWMRLPITSAEARLTSYRKDGSWRFPGGSSGAFGQQTHGPWQNFDQACRTWDLLARVDDDLSDWHDLHAALEPA